MTQSQADAQTLRLEPREWTVEMEDLQSFAALLEQRTSGTNPHVDEAYAATQIFGGLFVDGNQVVTKLVHWITDQLPPGAVVEAGSTIRARFRNPTRPGDTLTFDGTVEFDEARANATIEGRATSQAGKVVATIVVETPIPADSTAAAPGSSARETHDA